MMEEVTICIPAWEAEGFIDRTLLCAREQTHTHLRILVSVDQSTDGTVAICERHAQDDSRVEIFAQEDRLGWARNANFLLDRVESEFFFLYFHDDVIVPRYTEWLLQLLQEHPEAGSAHCDMGHFGAREYVSRGRSYEGTVARRLLTFLLAPERGSPLRSLTRRSLTGSRMRLPTNALGGFWANEPYLLRLIAAAPARALHETLYWRWDQRSGGLTDGWKKYSPAEMQRGFQQNITNALEIITESVRTKKEADVVTYALYLHTARRMRGENLPRAESLHSVFHRLTRPSDLSFLDFEARAWVRQAEKDLGKANELVG